MNTTRKKRDLTKDQFDYQARKLGFTPEGFLGYWKHTQSAISISVLNAGDRRRDRISYLRRNKSKFEQKNQIGN